jgi:lipoic acid synthetase
MSMIYRIILQSFHSLDAFVGMTRYTMRAYTLIIMDAFESLKKPDWLKIKVPSGASWRNVDEILIRHGLHTVCNEAKCPNKAECWGCGTATFMVLGDICTRGCRFCAVKTGKMGCPVRDEEPKELAAAVSEMGLRYAVITSVDRDDLPDRGASHFASCIKAIKETSPDVKVEVLVPDYFGKEISTIVEAGPDVIAHNVETVRRLQNVRDARASMDKSLRTLLEAKRLGAPRTKSSLLVGLGETKEEIIEAMGELRAAEVDILVVGQYLRPGKDEIPVQEYVRPEIFAYYAQKAKEAGFSVVVASPLARTSFRALEVWESGRPIPFKEALV